ncbi:MAG: precorrin-2 C(20)-methyltransferase [Lachnospiraceae bacterium]|jgi:precorrin-2 C(20)-methyltransferase|nr:precorrin-2 C(20)-methyltransferase [Lachnospiraceae bacterium]MBR3279383.1 precorrin-2 C(20)-methyltransferase [Lachnospiraceae bacterium]
MKEKGTFYGIGVGPGDPELITVKALKIIKSCPVIAAPRTGNGDMVALDIVWRTGVLAGTAEIAEESDKKILAMDFTMDKDPAKRKENYRKNAEAAARYLDNGQDVAMVTLGDVSLYSTVHYIADELISRGYEIIMVPGVPSFSAAAASLAIPLAEMDAPVHIIPSVRNNSDDYLDLPGTKVLMKAGRHLHRTLDELDRRGLLDVTSLAVNCGMDDEILIKKLGDDEPLPDKTGYFTTVIVRN